MKTILSFIIIAAISMTACALTTSAAIIVGSGESIQEAIDAAAAAPGADTIVISAGDYVENLTIEDPSPLSIIGVGGVTLSAPPPAEGEDPDHVISIDGGTVTLENISITAAGKDAINADDMNSLTLNGVMAFGNGDEGLQLEGVGTVTIRDSVFSENAGDGIQIVDAISVLLMNVLSENNDDGIDLEEVQQVEIRNSAFNGNEDEGIEGDDTGLVFVEGTLCKENEGEGIDLDDACQIVLKSVVCSDNENNGFQSVAESFATKQIAILNSQFTNNGKYGIQVEEEEDGSVAKVTLVSVDATGNSEGSLDIAISGVVTRRNVITD